MGYGLVEGDALRLASDDFVRRFPTLRSVLAGDAVQELGADVARHGTPRTLAGLALLPPIPDAARFICIGLNYPKRYPLGEDAPTRPKAMNMFAKLPGTLVGHEQPLEMPQGEAAETFDYEGELAVVIGRQARHVTQAQAWDHIAGFTIVNDGSVRAWQQHSVHAGKNFANSGACGPWMITADEIADPAALELTTRLNGRVVQNTTIGRMFFSIPEIIAYLSHTMPLQPGDIISTGSPEGAGMSQDPPRYLRRGDRLEIEISSIGCLANTVG